MRQKKKAPFASALPWLSNFVTDSLSSSAPFFSVCVSENIGKTLDLRKDKIMLCKTIKWHYLWRLTPPAPTSAPTPAQHSPCQMPNGALVYVIAVAPSCASRVYLWTLLMAQPEWVSFNVCVCVYVWVCAPKKKYSQWICCGFAPPASDYLPSLLFN